MARAGFNPLHLHFGGTELTDIERKSYSTSVEKAIALFKDSGIEDELNGVLERRFMPPRLTASNVVVISGNSHRFDHLLGLCYLSVLRLHPNKHPMTEEQAGKFAVSLAADARTTRWLGWRAWAVLGLTSVASSCVALIPLTQFKEDSEDNLRVQVGLTMTIGLMSAFIFGAYGLLWTGVYPNVSSIKANDKQNAMVTLRNDFQDMAHHLINLSFDQAELASLLANDIDIFYICTLLERYSGETNVDELTNLYLLNQAIRFIRHQEMPTDPSLRLTIQFNQLKKT